MSTSETPRNPLARRSVIFGAGAIAAGAGQIANLSSASAADVPPGPGGAVGDPRSADLPTSTIASPPVSGVTYRFADFFDFTAEGATSQRAWSAVGGTYTANSPSYLWASFELPPRARVFDTEIYVRNTSGTTYNGGVHLWVAGSATLTLIGVLPVAPNSTVTPTRVVIDAASRGPFVHGCKLTVGLFTPTTAQVVVNGCRVGFLEGAATTGLLPAPVRAYDSRETGGRLAAGSTRTITLPPSAVRPGVSGVLLNVTAVNPSGGGYLKVFSASAAPPAVSSVNYGAGGSIANAVTTGVSSARQIKVFTSTAVDVIVDVTGVLS